MNHDLTTKHGRQAAALEVIRRGGTCLEAAEAAGLSAKTVYAWSYRDDTWRKRYEQAVQVYRSRVMHDVANGLRDGVSLHDAAEAAGICRATATAWARRYGWLDLITRARIDGPGFSGSPIPRRIAERIVERYEDGKSASEACGAYNVAPGYITNRHTHHQGSIHNHPDLLARVEAEHKRRERERRARKREALRMVRLGMSPRGAADEVGLSPTTVRQVVSEQLERAS